MTWGTDRLEQLVSGTAIPPPVVETLRLGTIDEWEPGRVVKHWSPVPEIMNGDGTIFGGYLTALADQIMALATLSVIPDDRAFRTVNLCIQFFKVLGPVPLTVEGCIVTQSRTLITTDAHFIIQDGTCAARASAQQVTMPFPTR